MHKFKLPVVLGALNAILFGSAGCLRCDGYKISRQKLEQIQSPCHQSRYSHHVIRADTVTVSPVRNRADGWEIRRPDWSREETNRH